MEKVVDKSGVLGLRFGRSVAYFSPSECEGRSIRHSKKSLRRSPGALFVSTRCSQVMPPNGSKTEHPYLSACGLTIQRDEHPDDAEAAVRDVIDGTCPLCRVRLVAHDSRGRCSCCGDTYTAGEGRLEVRQCPEHGRDCAHWEAVWKVASEAGD